ncbi:MAG: hypothetical protein MUC49_11895 [Raineya sp.]|jgi:hypothetical protein|nr:hypothetical protein [Raineya sp.]
MKNYKLFSGLVLGISTCVLVACGVGGSSNLSVSAVGWSAETPVDVKFNPTNDNFKEFVANFKQAQFPLQLDERNIAFFKAKASWKNDQMQSQEPAWKKKLIADKFEEFVPSMNEGKFSRVPTHNETQYVAKLAENSQYVAVIYSISTAYGDYDYADASENTPVRFMLSIYNHKGEIIDEKVIAYNDRMGMATATIEKNLKIKTQKFENVFGKDEEGNSNYIPTGKKIKSEITYQISKNGTIETIGESKSKDKEAKDRTDYVF